MLFVVVFSPAKSDADIAVSYEEIPPQPPSPEPGTLEWVYVEQPIELVSIMFVK